MPGRWCRFHSGLTPWVSLSEAVMNTPVTSGVHPRMLFPHTTTSVGILLDRGRKGQGVEVKGVGRGYRRFKPAAGISSLMPASRPVGPL
jgi:hypothetical protein